MAGVVRVLELTNDRGRGAYEGCELALGEARLRPEVIDLASDPGVEALPLERRELRGIAPKVSVV